MHVGGVLNELEYVAAGEPLTQAFNAEHSAVPGDVIVSPQAFAVAGDAFANCSPRTYG